MIGLHILGILLIVWLAFYYGRLIAIDILREEKVAALERWVFFTFTLSVWGVLTWAVTLFCFFQ